MTFFYPDVESLSEYSPFTSHSSPENPAVILYNIRYRTILLYISLRGPDGDNRTIILLLHTCDDDILLQLPESLGLLFSWAN